ncbi:MAG: serine/threonine protein kinase [bacterium]|nr:serine/threonine protein kinase [bacterium]
MMQRLRLPLLLRLVLTLAAAGLLPLGISFYQLRTNKDALLDQVHRTHMVAASTAAARVESHLASLRTVARSLAANPVLYGDSQQELLKGTLQAQPAITVVGVYNHAGERVVRVQRSGMQEEIPSVREADAPALGVFRGATRRWLRIREAIPDDLGELILIAEAESLDEVVQAHEMGEAAYLVLANREGEVLFGHDLTLDDFPAAVVRNARTGKLSSGASRYRVPGGEDLIVAHSEVSSTPWFVLSRQPARVAEVAQRRIRQATRLSAVAAVLLAAVLSTGAYVTTIRPLRRLIRAQRQLVGADAGVAGGSEIEQLEQSFALLEQRVHDREDLGKVFLGRYQVVEVVGSGAMGTVFKGWDPKLERAIALKTIRLTSEEFKREKLVASLLKEASTSARFNHPNIATVYDVADEGTAAFIAMEFVDGLSLDRYVTARGHLGWQEIVPLGAAIARALAKAHEYELVHQDIKPGNILLGRDQSIKVTDFGISQLLTSASASPDMICGTPGYIAPEVFEGAGYTPRSDLFALGVLLHECLGGSHPFAGRNLHMTVMNTIHEKPEPIDHLHPDMPAQLAKLISQLLEKDPGDRPDGAAHVAAALDKMALQLELSWDQDVLAAPETPDEAREGVPRTQLLSLRPATLLSRTPSRLT